MAVLLLLNLCVGMGLRAPAPAAAYYCPGNCLKKVIWEGGRGTFRGALSTMTVPLGSYATTDGAEIRHALWVTDLITPGNVNGFVVVGVFGGAVQSPYYYWGDQRPGQYYYQENMVVIPQGQFGYNVDLQAWHYDDNNGGQYILTLQPSAQGAIGYTRYSYPNSMQPTRSSIGVDTSGGVAFSPVNWTYNKYMLNDYSVYYHLGMPNATAGGVPPDGYWIQRPDQSPTGGIWHVACYPDDRTPC